MVYNLVCRLLRWKQDNDPAFVNFLQKKRGAARHTLESLMLLPVINHQCLSYVCSGVNMYQASSLMDTEYTLQ